MEVSEFGIAKLSTKCRGHSREGVMLQLVYSFKREFHPNRH